MELEIGIVCGRCDAFAALGVTECGSCANPLALAISLERDSRDRASDLGDWPDAGPDAPDATLIDSGEAPDSPSPPTTREEPVAPEREVAPRRGSAVLLGSSIPSVNPSFPKSSKSKPGFLETREMTSDLDGIPSTPSTPSRPSNPARSVRTETVDAILAPPGEAIARANGSAPPDSYSRSASSRAPASRGERGRSSGHIGAVKSSKPKSVEELMDQAKNFVCRSCSTPVPMGHKFCGRCGAAVPPEITNARTQFFGQLQSPGKAKLILIRGEGVEGLSYQLNADQHVVGKEGQLVFPDDPFVSPKHANFFYKNGTLCVRDEGSLNGVYLRVRGGVPISGGDYFLAGEQVFKVDGPPSLNDVPGPDGTYFYSSPKHNSPFRITQILQGGPHGMVVCARSSSLQVGREGGDLNFPTDLYMSGAHCKIEETAGSLVLTDLSSRNGTYIRLKDERELGHGDYLFIGRKLLRVEITAA